MTNNAKVEEVREPNNAEWAARNAVKPDHIAEPDLQCETQPLHVRRRLVVTRGQA